MNIYEKLTKELEQDGKLILATKLSGSNGMIDESMKREILIQSQVPEEIKSQVDETLLAGLPKVIKGQGEDILFLEPFYKEERLIVLGGGHVALPVVEFGAKIGFSVTVVDDRPAFANETRFPLASQVVCDSFEQAIDDLHISEADYIVVITRGHRHDATCLRQLFQYQESIYLGMIGSKRRVAALKEMLKEEGLDGERLERICTPIGLSIGAITPEEIAISILAEIISRKRLDPIAASKGKSKYINRSDLDFRVIETLVEKQNEPRSIVTVISSVGSVPRGAGAKMIVYPNGAINGSIGGGCSEAAVIQNAIDIIGTGSYQIETIDLTGEAAEEEGMVCGGKMKVLIEDDVQR